MNTFKNWIIQTLCIHIWKERKVETLKKRTTHPMDDVLVTYLMAKRCLRCGKTKITTKTIQEDPDWLKQANAEINQYRNKNPYQS